MVPPPNRTNRLNLNGHLEPGQTVTVKGKTSRDSQRFSINFNRLWEYDVPLHMEVRFYQGQIIFNTMSEGGWGDEERKTSRIYSRGDEVDIRIRAHVKGFQIFFAGEEVWEYEHRHALNSITDISVKGDIDVTHMHCGGQYYARPYEGELWGGGLAPGKTLSVTGVPDKRCRRFEINLLNRAGDIVLHFNPRLNHSVIVRNSFLNGGWANEEREGGIPVESGTLVDLEIKNGKGAFEFSVNGEHFPSFAHRIEPNDLIGLHIRGDFEVHTIKLY